MLILEKVLLLYCKGTRLALKVSKKHLFKVLIGFASKKRSFIRGQGEIFINTLR